MGAGRGVVTAGFDGVGFGVALAVGGRYSGVGVVGLVGFGGLVVTAGRTVVGEGFGGGGISFVVGGGGFVTAGGGDLVAATGFFVTGTIGGGTTNGRFAC